MVATRAQSSPSDVHVPGLGDLATDSAAMAAGQYLQVANVRGPIYVCGLLCMLATEALGHTPFPSTWWHLYHLDHVCFSL